MFPFVPLVLLRIVSMYVRVNLPENKHTVNGQMSKPQTVYKMFRSPKKLCKEICLLDESSGKVYFQSK